MNSCWFLCSFVIRVHRCIYSIIYIYAYSVYVGWLGCHSRVVCSFRSFSRPIQRSLTIHEFTMRCLSGWVRGFYTFYLFVFNVLRLLLFIWLTFLIPIRYNLKLWCWFFFFSLLSYFEYNFAVIFFFLFCRIERHFSFKSKLHSETSNNIICIQLTWKLFEIP